MFKANSAILNALLTLLNEREFDNDGQRHKTPLVSLVGVSNELPEGEELSALYDRFLLRRQVGPVSDEGFEGRLDLGPESEVEVPAAKRINPDLLADVQRRAVDVDLPGDVKDLLRGLRWFAAEQQIAISDRRWRQVVKLLRVSALSNGREAVSVWDCWLLQHMLWETPEQRETVATWYAERVGNQEGWSPERLVRHRGRVGGAAAAGPGGPGAGSGRGRQPVVREPPRWTGPKNGRRCKTVSGERAAVHCP